MESKLLTENAILDGYRIIRFLGSGGFGEVWLCRSEVMGDYRALKMIPKSNPEHHVKEYESLLYYRNAAAQISSPHLVTIEHANQNEVGFYYVMPLADGVADIDPENLEWQPLSLSQRISAQIDQPTWFTSEEIIAIIQALLQALQTLSDAALVHRDVKPDNILYFDGKICLCDISLLGEDTVEITRRGTPGYGTPSWYLGGHPDMYGVAATLYTLLTGNSPDKMGRSAFLMPPQGEASLSESERGEWKRLHQCIRRATEEKVGDRYLDFQTMKSAILESSEHLDSQSETLPTAARSSKKIWLSVIAGTLGLASVVATVLFRPKHDQTEEISSQRSCAVENTSKS